MTDERRSLVLVGHGSHRDARARTPVRYHADRIRATGAFDEVREAFWKTAPSIQGALRACRDGRAYVVPLFTSEGYFVDEVIPRELLAAPVDGLLVRYGDPVGTHPSMTEVVRSAATAALGDSPGPDVGLAVVGHGTERNPDSARATMDHADRIAERGRFGEVRALFLDESPEVGSLTDHFDTDRVVAVPFFVAKGHHAWEDVPAAIGVDPDAAGPTTVDGTEVWYADPVGLDPVVSDVILQRAGELGADVSGSVAQAGVDDGRPDAAAVVDGFDFGRPERSFFRWLRDAATTDGRDATGSEPRPAATWGQVAILPVGEGRYELRHVEDRGRPRGDLAVHRDPREARSIAATEANGADRPLRSAPTLRQGWVFPALTPAAAALAIDGFYPASIRRWYRTRTGEADPVDFGAFAGRQTGMYAPLTDAADATVRRAARACCGDGGCLRDRRWRAPGEGSDPDAAGGIPCLEPCSLLAAAAREFATGDESSVRDRVRTAEAGDAPTGERHRQRRRYLADPGDDANPSTGEDPPIPGAPDAPTDGSTEDQP